MAGGCAIFWKGDPTPTSVASRPWSASSVGMDSIIYATVSVTEDPGAIVGTITEDGSYAGTGSTNLWSSPITYMIGGGRPFLYTGKRCLFRPNLSGHNASMTDYQWRINDNYEIRSMTEDEFEPVFQKYAKEFFEDKSQVFQLRNVLAEDERARMKKLSANMGNPILLRLGIFHKANFVGWHLGRQDSAASFYMQNSGVFVEHRRKGLYAELVRRVVQVATEMGFQDIWSRHNATNNAVIIPKLKQGFIITTLEVSDIFGTLVHLHYYPKEFRRRMADYRVGQIKPDAEIKKHLGI